MPKKLFQKGQSGNPGGRPKDLNALREAARAHTPQALKRLAEIMNQDENLVAAANAADKLLDRAWGKASQPIEGPDGKSAFEGLVVQIVTSPKHGDS